MKQAEKLSETVNVPLKPTLKRRLMECAKRHPDKPAYTRYARMLLERALDAELTSAK